jgi:ankyrin repeat protein
VLCAIAMLGVVGTLFMTVGLPVAISVTHRAELSSDPAPLIMRAIGESKTATQLTALIEANPSLVTDRDSVGGTLLHHAVSDGRPEMVRALLDHGCDPDAKGFLGITPLGMAITENRLDIVEILLAHSADPDAKTGFGRPLECAKREGDDEIAQAIRSAIERRRRAENAP